MDRGYKVRGSAIRVCAGKAGDISCPSPILKPFGYVLCILTSPLVYFAPTLTADMVAEKKLKPLQEEG